MTPDRFDMGKEVLFRYESHINEETNHGDNGLHLKHKS